MATLRNVLKKTGKVVLPVAVVGLLATKYCLSFDFKLSKSLCGGAKNLADSFVPSAVDTKIGEFALNETEKAVSFAADKTIALVKKVQGYC